MQPEVQLPKEKAIKIYSALLTQLDTNPPIATVLQNTIGNIIWTRAAEGRYTATLEAAFPKNKTLLFVTSTSGVLTEAYNNEDGEPSNSVEVRVQGPDGTLYITSFEIRVYS